MSEEPNLLSETNAMKAIADALVYAVAFINYQEPDEQEDFDDFKDANDLAMSHIMAYLSNATPAEEDALASAAKRALAEEKSLITPQQEMIDYFSNWMQSVFGFDWQGNDRA